jgi:hypothetical protein
MSWSKMRNGAPAHLKKDECAGFVEMSNGSISWDREDLSCSQFIQKVLSDGKIRWSLHKAFLNAWEGKVPTEVWLDVIKEAFEFNMILIDGLPEGHPWRARAEAKAAELCDALKPHLEWMEARMVERTN